MRPRPVEGFPLDVGGRAGAPVLGIEHEYRVLDGDEQLDFGPLLHTLHVEGLRLDPTDPNAYRTSWGGLLTSDGREAEVAIAPVMLRPGCTSEIEWRALVAHRVLAAALPDHLRLDGYSTHLNLEVDDDDVVGAGRLFVKRFAPAMMLLLDRPTSPGLLVRPRCGRLEIGGEYCAGDQLRAAATFAAAGGLACAAAVHNRAARRHLPRAVRSRVRPSNIRAGWYVDRRAFGTDLYSDGRSARLRWGAGRTGTAQAHLEEAWQRARPSVEPLLDESELRLVDRVVDGTLPLPLEAEPNTTPDPFGPFEGNPFEGVVRSRRRAGYSVEPISIAWDAVAFRLRGARDGIACIPRAALSEFLDDLDAGRLDAQIVRFLASPPQGRVLRASDQSGSPGLFDEIGSTGALAPPERPPGEPRRSGRGGGSAGESREQKSQEQPPPPVPQVAPIAAAAPQVTTVVKKPRRRGRKVAVTVGALVLLAAAAAGAAVLLKSDDKTDKAAIGVNALAGKYAGTFTIDTVKVGADFVENVPTVGTATSQQLIVTCKDNQCTASFDESAPISTAVHDLRFPPLVISGDHFEGTLTTNLGNDQCPVTDKVQYSVTADLTRDAAGAVTGFAGQTAITHPDGIFEDHGDAVCAAVDVTYALVGTKIS
ncbi:MAG: hypothetical protein QOI95_1034 [Acidimicrobiaceae bacterium]|jgi:hypothetical protein